MQKVTRKRFTFYIQNIIRCFYCEWGKSEKRSDTTEVSQVEALNIVSSSLMDWEVEFVEIRTPTKGITWNCCLFAREDDLYVFLLSRWY